MAGRAVDICLDSSWSLTTLALFSVGGCGWDLTGADRVGVGGTRLGGCGWDPTGWVRVGPGLGGCGWDPTGWVRVGPGLGGCAWDPTGWVRVGPGVQATVSSEQVTKLIRNLSMSLYQVSLVVHTSKPRHLSSVVNLPAAIYFSSWDLLQLLLGFAYL